MVDHPWLALGPRRLAVHAGTGGTAGREACGEVTVRASAADRHPRAGGDPVRRGFSAQLRLLWNTGSPGPSAQLRTRPGDDSCGCGGATAQLVAHAPFRN